MELIIGQLHQNHQFVPQLLKRFKKFTTDHERKVLVLSGGGSYLVNLRGVQGKFLKLGALETHLVKYFIF